MTSPNPSDNRKPQSVASGLRRTKAPSAADADTGTVTGNVCEQHLANMRYHLTEAKEFYRYGWLHFAKVEQRLAADELELALAEHD